MSKDSILPDIIICLATCVHPPGEDPISSKLVFFLINLYFLFSSINLNEALERKPNVFDFPFGRFV